MSIVVPTCNRVADLARCLERLECAIARTGRSDVEVLVTDDGVEPAAGTLAARFPAVRWLTGRAGSRRNRNSAARAAAGAWLLFTDDDCLPSEQWVGAMLAARDRYPEAKVLEGATTIDRPKRRLDEEAPWNENGGYLWACNMAIERALFLELGGFCEVFPAAASEDSDLKLRLDKAGVRTVFIREAVVCHPLRPTRGLRHQFRIGRSSCCSPSAIRRFSGPRPGAIWCSNSARMVVAALREGTAMRFRGLGHVLGRIAIHSGFSVVAILRRSQSA